MKTSLLAAACLAACVSTPAGVDLLHALLVHSTNLASAGVERNVTFPASRRPDRHCSDVQARVHLLDGVMSERTFPRVQRALVAAARRGLCYTTRGRKSCVLHASGVASAAPELRALHHDAAWAARISRAAGIQLHPLDERRFRMAMALHLYTSGSFNAAHLDSSRTSAKVWTVIFGVDNNSSSHLVIDGDECTVPANAGLVFEGTERLHWVPTLEGADVQRTIVFMEYAEAAADEVRWAWPWRKTLSWAERIFFH